MSGGWAVGEAGGNGGDKPGDERSGTTAGDKPGDENDNRLTPGDFTDTSRISTDFDAGAVPFNFELRGHYNRLMVNFGAEFGSGLGGPLGLLRKRPPGTGRALAEKVERVRQAFEGKVLR